MAEPDAQGGQVRCGDCLHFEHDLLGNGTGIGRCALRLVRAPFPLVPRYCNSYEQRHGTVHLHLTRQVQALQARVDELLGILAACHKTVGDLSKRITRYELPGKLPNHLPPDKLLSLIQHCHPDKHGNSRASTQLTQWLLDLRKRI